MKFVLKVLVLAFLVVMSKLAKDEAITMQKPVARKAEATPVFTSSLRETQTVEKQPSVMSAKFLKSSLQFN